MYRAADAFGPPRTIYALVLTGSLSQDLETPPGKRVPIAEAKGNDSAHRPSPSGPPPGLRTQFWKSNKILEKKSLFLEQRL